VAAQPTYNPLGRAFTFTNSDDILAACAELLQMACHVTNNRE
jgi:hypothetical protein